MSAMAEELKPDSQMVERFRIVVLPHLDAAYRLCRWLTRDATDAQDLTQESMLRALRYFHAFRGDQARPWLLRIVRNTWSDLRRRKAAAGAPMEEAEEVPDDAPGPEQNVEATDRRRLVAAALAELAPPLREVLVLREIEDLSYKQIAEVMDLPIGTVMSRLARARERLAEVLVARLGRSEHGLRDL
jgi:RNA polymerase sigma-70 factor (ECF subfamily)